jgi:ubiquinone/menaquinone biosynthesis C-methylase UbiE
MRRLLNRAAPLWVALLLSPAPGAAEPPGAPPPAPPGPPAPRYECRDEHDPDGIGKFYLGREIARVVSHEGAAWLERPERAAEEQPDELVRRLRLQPGMVVADVGAGTGYLSRRLAREVGPTGVIYANEVQPQMLARLQQHAAREDIGNLRPVLGTEDDPRLPTNAIDLAIMVDVYHEFALPYEMLAGIHRALKPDGRLVFVEYRGEDPAVPIKPLHRMTESQVRREAEVHPFEWVETIRTLPRQHVIVFRKRGAS